MLSDAAGVFIALLAAWIAARPASDLRTYGYQRAEVLAALANALILVVIAVVIFTEAIRRIGSAPEVQTDIMLYAAVLGAAANLASLLILRGARRKASTFAAPTWRYWATSWVPSPSLPRPW